MVTQRLVHQTPHTLNQDLTDADLKASFDLTAKMNSDDEGEADTQGIVSLSKYATKFKPEKRKPMQFQNDVEQPRDTLD